MKINVASFALVYATASTASASSAALSGVGFDALHINPYATAVVSEGTYDARNIVARDDGADPLEGGYGLFVDEHAKATVCNASLIKGGTEHYNNVVYGRGGVYVGSDATLNIVDGVIEGGDSTETQFGAYGIYASYELNKQANSIVITGGEILGGMRAGAEGDERGESIFTEAGGTITVYGGVIGDNRSNSVMDVSVGLFGDLPAGNNVATVNIHGGTGKGPQSASLPLITPRPI